MVQWITPSGFLFTATEAITTSTTLAATGTSSVNFIKTSGSLPQGFTLSSTGTISGTTGYVLDTTRNYFTVKASDQDSFSERDFYIDVQGSDAPAWDTYSIVPGISTGTTTTSTGVGYVSLGINGAPYAMYRQWVDYQFKAHPAEAPSNAGIKYYISFGDGNLPQGLNLNENGVLSGYVQWPTTITPYDQEFCFPNVTFDSSISTSTTSTYVLVGNGYRLHSLYITASDGVKSTKKLFKILITDPVIFKNTSTYFPTGIDILDYSILPNNPTYLQTPQFIKSSDLGVLKVGNEVYLPVKAYDPAPSTGPIVYSINTTSGTITTLPNFLELDSSTGYIVGYPGQQREYKKNFSLTINATKYNTTQTESVNAVNTFTFAVQNGLIDFINWEKTGNIGSISVNEISELYVKAVNTGSFISLKYKITSGELPPGLSLNRDGSIYGQVPINTATVATATNYNFDISVLDNNDNEFINGSFSITVNQTTSTDYTSIWCRPYLNLSERSKFSSFIKDTNIFDPNILYRPLDPNFGTQSSLKMYINFGVKKLNLSEYISVISQNFYKRRFTLSSPNYVIARKNNKTIYELIYLPVIDELVNNNGESVAKSFVFNGVTYYPPSWNNMRSRIKDSVEVTDFLDPQFAKTIQANSFDQLGLIKYVPLCYVLPDTSLIILRKIKENGFIFNKIDFEIDRIFVDQAADKTALDYLLFPIK